MSCLEKTIDGYSWHWRREIRVRGIRATVVGTEGLWPRESFAWVDGSSALRARAPRKLELPVWSVHASPPKAKNPSPQPLFHSSSLQHYVRSVFAPIGSERYCGEARLVVRHAFPRHNLTHPATYALLNVTKTAGTKLTYRLLALPSVGVDVHLGIR